MVLGGLPDMLRIPWDSLASGRRIIAGPAAERADDLRTLATLAEAGAFRPVIDRCLPFEQIVDAHRVVDTGRKRGNLVVTFARDGA
jgi:D-arabinose 1-dehydrogenase-like Zn-dependent alcohol dehydrogenase